MTGKLVQRGKAKVWYIRTYEGVDPDTGKEIRNHICLHTTDKKIASEMLTQFLAAHVNAERLGPNPTVEHFLERWLTDHCAQRLESSTFAAYQSNIRNKVLPHIGKLRLRSLRPTDLRGMWARLAESGGKGGTPLSRRSVQYVHAILRAALEQAVNDDLLTKNPAQAATPPAPEREEQAYLRPEEAVQLLKANESDPWLPFAKLVVFTGLRRGEALALQWDAIDFDRQTLTVKSSRKRLPFHGGVVNGKPKTVASRRTIPLPPLLIDALKQLRVERAEECLNAGLPMPDMIFVHLLRDQWTGWSPDTVGKAMRRMYKRAGLADPAHPTHALRHTQATMLAIAGVHPKVAQELMGHADMATTMNAYTHVVDESKRAAADAVADLLGPKNKQTRVRKAGGAK